MGNVEVAASQALTASSSTQALTRQINICPLISDPAAAPVFRIPVEASIRSAGENWQPLRVLLLPEKHSPLYRNSCHGLQGVYLAGHCPVPLGLMGRFCPQVRLSRLCP